ncbi:MAG: acetyl-CoA C-acyltransferase [Bacteroidales bacterium]|nr:acetyl-CoA C-acyltransferase [Bacteroidales bacterium]
MKEVFIVSAVRTPIGSFGGALATVPATKLGAIAIEGAIKKAGIDPNQINEVFMGNVLQANEGQAPARQAALFAGVPNTVPCTTVNKVCASGMKSIMLGAQTILLGDNDVVVAGGMENMSLVPHYMHMRNGVKMGDVKMADGMIKDGLWDVYNNYHMGNAGELCAKEYGFTREEQDEVAIESYKRAAAAWDGGNFNDEIVPVVISTKKGDIIVNKDEEYTNVKFDKIPQLKPVFQKDGTITAANASTINDGASAVILMSGEKVKELGLTPIAKVIGYGDAAGAPEWFTTAPAKAVPIALAKAGIKQEDVAYFELNEAFAVVPMVAEKMLNIDHSKVNVWGSGCSLGHPLGNTGSRITVTLISVLRQNNAKYGVASLCNGGGGASALVIEAL